MKTATNFTIGQKVTFTMVRRSGNAIRFTSHTGVLEEMDGEVAIVKMRNGSTHSVSRLDLRAEGERNSLTEAVLAGLGREPT